MPRNGNFHLVLRHWEDVRDIPNRPFTISEVKIPHGLHIKLHRSGLLRREYPKRSCDPTIWHPTEELIAIINRIKTTRGYDLSGNTKNISPQTQRE